VIPTVKQKINKKKQQQKMATKHIPLHCRVNTLQNSTSVITINVPVVFMARYVMVLRGATSLRGALEGVGPENRDFFGP
jgi:hypothetical protein